MVFRCFFSLVETSKRFPRIFFHSTFSRSKRQSKKRSRARQSDARSSVGPEDCQRRVKPWLFGFPFQGQEWWILENYLFKSGMKIFSISISFFNKFELVWLGLSPCHGCKISWAGHDRACTTSLAEQPRWWRRGTLRRCVLMTHSRSLSFDGKKTC